MGMPASLIAMLLLVAGCATLGSSLHNAADTLDSRTQRFYEELRRDRADDHSMRDAEALADAADDFRRAVERRESREELDSAFDRVAEHYHHLRNSYGEREREERERFEAITEAYVEVEGALKYRDTRHG